MESRTISAASAHSGTELARRAQSQQPTLLPNAIPMISNMGASGSEVLVRRSPAKKITSCAAIPPQRSFNSHAKFCDCEFGTGPALAAFCRMVRRMSACQGEDPLLGAGCPWMIAAGDRAPDGCERSAVVELHPSLA